MFDATLDYFWDSSNASEIVTTLYSCLGICFICYVGYTLLTPCFGTLIITHQQMHYYILCLV
jgi:hypothetical protein